MAGTGEGLNGDDEYAPTSTSTSAPRPPTPLNFNLLKSLQAQLAQPRPAQAEAETDTIPNTSDEVGTSIPLASSLSAHDNIGTTDSPASSRKHDSAIERFDSTTRNETSAPAHSSTTAPHPPAPAPTSTLAQPPSRASPPREVGSSGRPPTQPEAADGFAPLIPSTPTPVIRRQPSRGTIASSFRGSTASLRRFSGITFASRSASGGAGSGNRRVLRKRNAPPTRDGSALDTRGGGEGAPPVPPVQRVTSFYGISMDIPKADLRELKEGDGGLKFSNRGSVFIDGEKMGAVEDALAGRFEGTRRLHEPQETQYQRVRASLDVPAQPANDLRPSLDVTAASDTASFHTATIRNSAIAHHGHVVEPEIQESAQPDQAAEITTADHDANGNAEKNQPDTPTKGLQTGRRKPSVHMLQSALEQGRVLSAEEISLSLRIRSMYEHGDEKVVDWSAPAIPTVRTVLADDDEDDTISDLASDVNAPASQLSVAKHRTVPDSAYLRPSTSMSRGMSNSTNSVVRSSTEVAGGLEDYEEISTRDVDRYGFIRPGTARSHASGTSKNSDGETRRPAIQRVSTSLALISDAPRRRYSRKGRHNAAQQRMSLVQKQAKDARSLRTQGSFFSVRSGTSSLRSNATVGGRSFSGRSRKLLDQASDMLTLPPGLEDIAEQEDGGRTVGALKEREWAREDKWRKMALVRSSSKSGKRRSGVPSPSGGGMRFDFDTGDARVVSRTWKGIPDRWRATAWHSFLSASRRRRGGLGQSDEELAGEFHALQGRDCADDVQIDVDVPRTIGMHVMFRRRYRGGQRLLFRVLHAVALKFPDVGYVQGMASLATTLLCYFDEEMAFVMMVRLWELRGLKALFANGFGGLMAALGQYERDWLARTVPDVAAKLDELGIGGTAYGTRWYLTLFNMSIPFPAQLRVWDVFMLLGDGPVVPPMTTTTTTTGAKRRSVAGKTDAKTKAGVNGEGKAAAGEGNAAAVDFGGAELDVLHATSAALIDATREVLLDSDFENAMKVLTSWIPVKDEDLLMRVAKAEWKAKKRRE